ncbi:MAG: MraY family glycosyltransferase [Candidatus Omnitrophota bacterium]
MRLRYILLFSFAIAYALTPMIRLIARRMKIYDYPNRRKIHKRPVALLGGVSVYLAFMIPLCFNLAAPSPLQGIMIAGTIIFIAGLMDDVKKLPASTRLVTQVLAAVILIIYDVKVSFLPVSFLGNIGESVLTVVWIVGITNAMNCLDGVDGLAASLGIIIAGCFFAIAYSTDQPWFGYIAIALVGGLLGFLKYNLSPAKIFLGDAGSTFIGFMLACVAMLGTYAENGKVSLFIPLLVLGIPIYDMCMTTILRVRKGVVKNVVDWLKYAGKDHFHHRLIDLGFGPRGIIALMGGLSLWLGLSAIVLRDSDIQDALLLLIQAAIVFTVITILIMVGARERRRKRSR